MMMAKWQAQQLLTCSLRFLCVCFVGFELSTENTLATHSEQPSVKQPPSAFVPVPDLV